MKKKNLKGFTLVEVVVVATMMVIMMGAILRFIKPMQKFYQNTWNTADANDIGIDVMAYFESEIRYATNVCVLEDYEGMPNVVDGYLVNAAGNKSVEAKFTDVIIIDNVNPRGKVLDSYDPNDSPSHRKGATGQILKVSLATGSIDLDNVRYPVTEAKYSDFKCDFTARLSTENKNKALSIGMKMYRPVYKNGAYNFNKLDYSQQRDVELVNINLIGGAGMKVTYYTNAVDESGNRLGTAIDYAAFARNTSGGLSEGKSAYYDTSKKYTYIFYSKKVPTNSDRVTVRLLYEDGTVYGTPRALVSGSVLPSTLYNSWLASDVCAGGTFYDASGNRVTKTFDKLITTSGEDADVYLTQGITESLDFIAKFTTSAPEAPKGYVTFIDYFEVDGTPVPGGRTVQRTGYFADNPYITDPGDGAGDETHIFVEWNSSSDGSTGAFDPATRFMTGDYNFYAIYRERAKYHISMLDGDGNEVFNKEFYEGLTSGSTVTADADFPANPAAPEGYHFKGWYLNGDVTAHTVDLLTAAEFTGDLVYQAVFEADPTSGAFLTVSMNSTPDKQQTSWWPTNLFKPKAEVKLSLQNTGTEGTSGSSAISFKMNGPIERVDCWNNVDITISGDTVYVTYKDVIYPADDPDGSHWRRSDTLTLYVYGSTEGDEATINAINFTASDLSNSTT